MSKRKAGRITVTKADGSSEVVAAGHFQNNAPKRWRTIRSRAARSKRWRALRRAALKRVDYRCQGCKKRRDVLEVHHLTYERLGRELPEDVVVLCQRCHATTHQWAKRKAG